MPEGQPNDIDSLVKKTKEQQPLTGQSIVFDNGNTIVFDPFDELKGDVAKKATKIASDDFRVNLDTAKFLNAWSEANDKVDFQFASHFSQEEPWIQSGLRAARVSDGLRPILASAILIEYRKAFKELLESDPRGDEIRQTLTELRKRGKHLVVLSNDRDFVTRSMLTWIGVADLFDHFLTSEEIGIEKPDPSIFTVAAEKFEKPIGDIVYVGDDPERDIECAHKAGVKAVLYVPPKKYRSSTGWRDYLNLRDEPDAAVENFHDLLNVIR